MKDSTKTIAFAAVAAVILLAIWFGGSSQPANQRSDLAGQFLAPAFTDPLKAASLEIVQFDEQTGEPRKFEVAQVKDVWSIPSHSNYPTDAANQFSEAVGGLTNLKIMSVESENAGDYAEYGLNDPTKAKPGDAGVGTRVVIRDKDNKELLGIIIGKSAAAEKGGKPLGADKSEIYYVRTVDDQAPVCVVEVKTDKLSTKFEDWIERNLLKISTWDMKGLDIKDYSVNVLPDGPEFDFHSTMELACNDADPKWTLAKCEVLDEKADKLKPAPLGPEEELDTSKLDAMKTALDDLKIIDVARKPAGLTAGLKTTGSIKPDDESYLSLKSRGFYLLRTGPKSVGLYSNKGEIVVQMKDGVEYVLRFGGIAGASAQDKDAKKDAAKDKKDAAKDKKDEEPTGPGVNRYLFVMAEFNPDLIPKPTFEKLPEEKAPADKPETENKFPADKLEVEKKDEKPAAKGAPGEKGKPGKTNEADETVAKPDESAADKEMKDDATPDDATPDDAKKDEIEKDNAKPDETKKDETKPVEKRPVEKKPDPKVERERIEKENKRKQDEYDEKLKKGQEKANELNARFAQWYYVISDDVYRKIHITRDQIVKKKEKAKDGKGKAKDKEAGLDDEHDHDHGDAAEAKKKLSEKEDHPIGEFDKLKQEGPGGKE